MICNRRGSIFIGCGLLGRLLGVGRIVFWRRGSGSRWVLGLWGMGLGRGCRWGMRCWSV